jgi:hypothetical protein
MEMCQHCQSMVMKFPSMSSRQLPNKCKLIARNGIMQDQQRWHAILLHHALMPWVEAHIESWQLAF